MIMHEELIIAGCKTSPNLLAMLPQLLKGAAPLYMTKAHLIFRCSGWPHDTSLQSPARAAMSGPVAADQAGHARCSLCHSCITLLRIDLWRCTGNAQSTFTDNPAASLTAAAATAVNFCTE